ncbi:hypothetical protein M9Y10_012338 [Tritrichomonas musculus]|uniref:non-specific serine/threonine protein kinase n=1 Tax=Tritrichomonas musculus TaxID=1915356 RepID=A0ABR2IC92_9EUKA
MIQNLKQEKTDSSGASNTTPAVHMNTDFEWEYDPLVNPSSIFAKVRIIGQGSFGTVAEILHSPSMTILAGKLINQNFLENEVSKNELTKEIELLRKIESPYTIKYFGSVPLEGSLMILMEYCDRCSLRNILDARQQVLSEDQISLVMFDVLKGLETIHNDFQIAHRDIKSSNILITSNGDIKISDFGITRIFESDQSQNMTIIGSPYWMAPEVISGIPYSYEADIWSIGITAVELCEGAPPFAELDPTKAMIEITIKGFPGYRFPSMHSPEICDFISHCIETDPNKRWKIEQLLNHPFIKRSENLDKYETLQNIIEVDHTKIAANNKITTNNIIYDSINNSGFTSKTNSENYGTFVTFGESDVNSGIQSQIQSAQQNLPDGHNFVKQRIDGNSFEGMAMIMSQKFNNSNFDSFNSGSFNASMSDFGNFSDDDPFKPDNNIINNNYQASPNESTSGSPAMRNYDSMADFNLPFGESAGIDSFDFGSFQQQQQQSPNLSNDDFLSSKIEIKDNPHSSPSLISHQASYSNTIGQKSESPFSFLSASSSNFTINQTMMKKDFVYHNASTLKKRSNNMKNVPDKLFVEVSRAISPKIPFVPFSMKPQTIEKKKQPTKEKIKKNNDIDEFVDDDDSIDHKINKIRNKLSRSPPLIALTIFLFFFFIFGFEAVFPLCGLLIVVSLLLRHYKKMQNVKKEENKENPDDQ